MALSHHSLVKRAAVFGRETNDLEDKNELLERMFKEKTVKE